jgi:hypothetical protein
MNLLLQPYAVLFMLIFCRLAKAAAWSTVVQWAYLGFTVLLPTILYLQSARVPLRLPTAEGGYRTVDALRALDVSGSPMIQWGWSYLFYIESGMTWGTRTGGSHEILERFFPNKSIYVADYVESLESGRAPVFLDTATEGAFFYAWHAFFGHEGFPEIAGAVRRNYFSCAEFPGAVPAPEAMKAPEIAVRAASALEATPTGLSSGRVVAQLQVAEGVVEDQGPRGPAAWECAGRPSGLRRSSSR